MSNKDKDLASSNKTKTKKSTEKNNKPVHKNLAHNQNIHSASKNPPRGKEVSSKDSSSGKKHTNDDNEKLFTSELKEQAKKITPEIEFHTDHGEDENFISALKNKAKELASKVGLIDEDSSNHKDDKGIVSSIKDTAKELASKVGLTDDKTSDHNRKESKKDNHQ